VSLSFSPCPAPRSPLPASRFLLPALRFPLPPPNCPRVRPPDSLIPLFLCAFCGHFVAIRANWWLIIRENPRNPWLLENSLDTQQSVMYNIHQTNRITIVNGMKYMVHRLPHVEKGAGPHEHKFLEIPPITSSPCALVALWPAVDYAKQSQCQNG